MYVIAFTENAQDLVRDDSDQIQKFKNPKSARDFLRDHGINKPEKEGMRIIPYEPASESRNTQDEITS